MLAGRERWKPPDGRKIGKAATGQCREFELRIKCRNQALEKNERLARHGRESCDFRSHKESISHRTATRAEEIWGFLVPNGIKQPSLSSWG